METTSLLEIETGRGLMHAYTAVPCGAAWRIVIDAVEDVCGTVTLG